MMRIVLTGMMLFSTIMMVAQPATTTLYDPAADGIRDIASAVIKASAEKKHVLIQAGGNWCSWCMEFNRFCKADRQIDSMLKSDFVVYHLNYSNENKNAAVMAKLGYPQRFGFPVFLVLDASGNRLHSQNSSYLEQGRTYHKGKVLEFLQHWNRQALNPSSYSKF